MNLKYLVVIFVFIALVLQSNAFGLQMFPLLNVLKQSLTNIGSSMGTTHPPLLNHDPNITTNSSNNLNLVVRVLIENITGIPEGTPLVYAPIFNLGQVPLNGT